MYPVTRNLFWGAGIFFLACGLAPSLLYSIFNFGTAITVLIGAALTALPRLWTTVLADAPRLRLFIAVVGIAFAVFCLTVSGLMARRAWFCQPPASAGLPAVVLGGGIVGDQPSLMLRRRLDTAARYLESNPEAVCVVTGGQGPDEEYPEAHVMKRYLVEQGIGEERIFVEDQSANTRQNIRFAKAFLDGAEEIVIVTDGFHQLRAGVFAAAEGLGSFSLSSSTPWGLLPSYWMREIFGVSWAWVSIFFQLV